MSGFGTPVLNELVGAETLLALAAIHKRIRKSAKMSRGDPCLRIHQNSSILPHIVRILLYEFLPPCTLYVVFQFNAERSVIPCVGKTAVYLGSGENKAAVFAQRDYFIHCFFFVVHFRIPLS